MLTKICSKCKKIKDISKFPKRQKAPYGVDYYCRICHKKMYKKRYSHKNRREYLLKRSYTPRGRFLHYRSEAKQKNRVFELTLEQFIDITSRKCYYCDQFSEGHDYCGIDRVDTTQGYLLTNVIPCCKMCNKMKLDHTEQKFMEQCKRIIAHYDSLH